MNCGDGSGMVGGCEDAMAEDLGWGLGMVFRAYVTAAHTAVADLPGGPRGYQVLSTAVRGTVNSQLALAQHLGVDRTVMTYLLDDLEAAGLIERRPDPADRRARRVVATDAGIKLLIALDDRLRSAEAQLLAPLDEPARETFAPRSGCSPPGSMLPTRRTILVTSRNRQTRSCRPPGPRLDLLSIDIDPPPSAPAVGASFGIRIATRQRALSCRSTHEDRPVGRQARQLACLVGPASGTPTRPAAPTPDTGRP